MNKVHGKHGGHKVHAPNQEVAGSNCMKCPGKQKRYQKMCIICTYTVVLVLLEFFTYSIITCVSILNKKAHKVYICIYICMATHKIGKQYLRATPKPNHRLVDCGSIGFRSRLSLFRTIENLSEPDRTSCQWFWHCPLQFSNELRFYLSLPVPYYIFSW